MLAYVIRRLWQIVPTLLGVVLLVFCLFNWVGGDPAYLLAGKISNPEQIANIRITSSSGFSSSKSPPVISA
jgi:peptide/nickel transport system permease protein